MAEERFGMQTKAVLNGAAPAWSSRRAMSRPTKYMRESMLP